MGGRWNFFFSDKFGLVGEKKFFNLTDFTDRLHQKILIFIHTNFIDRHSVLEKNLAEKVKELTDFIGFGAEKKTFYQHWPTPNPS
jgi:hypothetical protein